MTLQLNQVSVQHFLLWYFFLSVSEFRLIKSVIITNISSRVGG